MKSLVLLIFTTILTSLSIKVFAITTDQFPYQASFHIENGTSFVFVCSGALISPKWVLTTSSCLRYNPKMVRVGSSDFTTGGQTSTIDSTHIHPKYNRAHLFVNDIALVSLNRNILFDSRVKAIKMANYEPLIGAHVSAIGWGPHANSPKYNPVLLSALNTLVVGRSQCNLTVYQLSRHFIGDDVICTGGNGRGFCQENLGSVLATRDGVLYGIAMWTQICGKTLNHDLFVSVAYHRDFIRQITGK